MAPREISVEVLDAKLEACKFAFSKLSAIKTTRMKNYKQLRTLLMMKEIVRRGADRNYLRDPENTVTRILCSILKQVATNSERCLPSLSEQHFSNLDDKQKLPVIQTIQSIHCMASKKYITGDTTYISNPNEITTTPLILGIEDDSYCGEIEDYLRPPISLETSITLEWVENLMDTLRWITSKNMVTDFLSVLPCSVAVSLIDSASEIMEREANIINIDCFEAGSKVILVGDLQGHFHDLLKILDSTGRPSENQCFVFTGNYAGAGPWGAEVFLVLLAWKILMPQRVFLLRGNHETTISSQQHGFLREICEKFGDQGDFVYKKFLDIFKLIPLASIIANSVYTSHGGLFRSTQVESEGTENYISLGCLEELYQVDRKWICAENGNHPIILDDVLWSNPWMTNGLVVNNKKGAGLLWGPDATETFFRQSNLKVIIRSNDVPDISEDLGDMNDISRGYSLDHDVESGKLYSLFSASMYSQGLRSYRNEGAYAVLEPPDFTSPRFITYTVENIQKPSNRPSTSDSSSAQQCSAMESISRHNFESIGILNPPSWTLLAADATTEPASIQLPDPWDVEGLPLPDNIEEPHRSNYEYLFRLVTALKSEIKTRDDRESTLMVQMKKMQDALKAIGKMSSSVLQ